MVALEENASAARARYEEIKSQCDVQALVLRKLQSRLHIAKEEADTFERLTADLGAGMPQLGGYLHPIRRCPGELLRMIFEEDIRHQSQPFFAAVRLSHVCQQWRDVALATSVLWKEISITSGKSNLSGRLLAKAFASRAKHAKTDITIEIFIDESDDSREIIESIPFYELYSVTAISHLGISLYSEVIHRPPFFDIMHQFPTCEVENLSISSDSGGAAANPFLARFLPIRVLSLNNASFGKFIAPNLHKTVETLVEANFYGVTRLPTVGFLRLTPNLQILAIEESVSVPAQGDDNSPCIMPSLQSLKADCENFPWDQLQCPNLTKLETPYMRNDPGDEPFWNFLSATPTVSDVVGLGLCTARHIVRLATKLPHVTHLKIWSDIDTIKFLTASTSADLRGPAFPNLLHLDLWIRRGIIPIIDLHDLVRFRCLPREHPQSMLCACLAHPLETLTLFMESDSVDRRIAHYLERNFVSKSSLLPPGLKHYTFVSHLTG